MAGAGTTCRPTGISRRPRRGACRAAVAPCRGLDGRGRGGKAHRVVAPYSGPAGLDGASPPERVWPAGDMGDAGRIGVAVAPAPERACGARVRSDFAAVG